MKKSNETKRCSSPVSAPSVTLPGNSMAKEPKPLPTKVEIVRWLKKQLAAGKHVDVYDDSFDIFELVSDAVFEKPDSSHQLYTLKMRLIDHDLVGEYEVGPDVNFEVDVNGVVFRMEAPYEEIRDGMATWEPDVELMEGVGAKRFKNIDKTLNDLIEKYAHWHFPDPENCNYPCEGAGFNTLYNALYALEQDGAKIYTCYEIAFARYPEDKEEDFADYELSNAEDAAAMLVETMEYECDWSECFD